MSNYLNKNKLTNQRIQTSFLTLMSDISFNQITVNKICQAAKINRSTFYRHYHDKYHVLEIVEQGLLDEISHISHDQFEQSADINDMANYLNNIVDQLLQVVNNNRELLMILMSANGDANLYNRLRQIFSMNLEVSRKKISERNSMKIDHSSIDIKLATEFIVTADITILRYTINNPDIPCELIKETFKGLLVHGPLHTLYNFSK
ncbi:TetR/AcrR family transcriptional regulator [Fructobacillus fructosus]|uniref:AcrR family n=1 Tax=Fructobacillus fructosus TaxID=1631 RepID=A0ABN9YRM8_9LACO|nr:AcrR family [Fructobacillus fructosus]